MSQIVQSHANSLPTATVAHETKERALSFLNIVRSIFAEFSAIGIVVFISTQLHEGRLGNAVLIASAGTGAVLGLFVVFHLYLKRKPH